MGPKEKRLEVFTTAELQNEINERRRKERRRAIEERERFAALWVEHRETLLKLIPAHRKSCPGTDTAPADQSGAVSCERCFILHAKAIGWWDPEFALTLDIRYDPLGEED